MYQFFSSDVFGLPADTANLIATIVLALLAVFILYMIYRMITRPRMASGRRSKHARLAITDAASVDDRRKLVLVRRDDVEHLIMIGGTNDIVIEADITRMQAARTPEPASAPVAPTPAPAPARTPPAPPSPPQAAAPATPPVAAAKPAPVMAEPKPAPAVEPVKPATASPSSSGLTMPAVGAAAVGAATVVGDTATGAVEKVSDTVSTSAEKVSDTMSEVKTTVSEDMDALLSEITTDK